MFCDHRRSAVVPKRRDKMCFWYTAGAPNSLGQAPPDTLKNFDASKFPLVKSDPLCVFSAMPDGLANASRPHSKLRTRSPLCGEFIAGNPSLVPASVRNRLPFTSVHSHADALKSSGAFFRNMDRVKVPETAISPQNGAEGPCGGAAKRCYGKSGALMECD